MREAAAGVFVRAAEALNDAVKGDEHRGPDRTHRCSFFREPIHRDYAGYAEYQSPEIDQTSRLTDIPNSALARHAWTQNGTPLTQRDNRNARNGEIRVIRHDPIEPPAIDSEDQQCS